MNKIQNFQYGIALAISTVVVCLYALSVNPLFWGFGNDSSLYIEQGKLIISGGIP